MTFRLATKSDVDAVASLYDAARGLPFCTWDDEYPLRSDATFDGEHGNLYVLADGATVVGALSVVTQRELDTLDVWTSKEAEEIARVVVSPAYRGRGLAAFMVEKLCDVLQNAGVRSLHLLAATENPPAVKTYQKCGFTTVGECFMYGHRYYAMERQI